MDSKNKALENTELEQGSDSESSSDDFTVYFFNQFFKLKKK